MLSSWSARQGGAVDVTYSAYINAGSVDLKRLGGFPIILDSILEIISVVYISGQFDVT